MNSSRIYLLVLTGELAEAQNFVASRYPGAECVFVSKRELRESGWRGQAKALGKMQGEAVIFFVRSLSDMQEPQLVVWSSLLHRCRLTILADSTGRAQVYSRWSRFFLLPRTIASALSDVLILVVMWISAQILRSGASPSRLRPRQQVDIDLAYLYPYPMDSALAGGALSHVGGFLSGASTNETRCEVFSGRPLPVRDFRVHVIPVKRRFFLFRETLMLSYNLRFAFAVRKLLRGRRLQALYQRHGRFVVVGAILSWWLGAALILEYNGSEMWMVDHWDPSRFQSWLRLCEEISISRAHLIVVVSEALKQQLKRRGVPEDRILVNPNAVDPATFQPGCGGNEVRTRFGLAASDVVIGFVGTFNYWHGTDVLARTLRQLLHDRDADAVIERLRFLLVGEGLLLEDMKHTLEAYVGSRVFFSGVVPHSQVAAYLDAADIVVSPHVPMPDGQPFFGSPTKIFEYMAMAKAIIASDLDQLAQVLKHEKTAWLVEPGNVSELASAIVLLARNPVLRHQLGQSARACALADHTWQQNAERVLARIRTLDPREVAPGAIGAKVA